MRLIDVADPSAVAEARREAVAQAERQGFDEDARGRVALVATELATNLLKHAGGGRLVVQPVADRVELLALDSGPGMGDVAACLADGYSTAGTRGAGLGAAGRLANAMRVLSWPGVGTAVLARLAPTREASVDEQGRRTGAVAAPLPGEAASGDGWAVHAGADATTLFVVDGLGHGPDAARAAHVAVSEFQRQRDRSPTEIVHAVHQAMRATRGGAVAVARIEPAMHRVVFCGLGNIAGVLLSGRGEVRRMVSHNGTAGVNARRVQAFDYPFDGGLVVMHTDGVSANWSPERYPGLVQADPLLVAGVLFQQHARGRDDATVLVARVGP